MSKSGKGKRADDDGVKVVAKNRRAVEHRATRQDRHPVSAQFFGMFGHGDTLTLFAS